MTTAGGPRVAAVVVTHDTRDDAVACLAALPPADVDEVCLVDCGSADGTAAAVRHRFPHVKVVEPGNAGYGQGANAGVAVTSAPYVVVANADTRFTPGAVAALVAALAADPDVGAAGPLVRHPDGRVQPSARRLPTVAQALGHAALGAWWPDNPWTRAYLMADEDLTRARDVDWVSGCALAVRREAFAEVGGFDPRYFMFVEDVDLGWRLGRAGWRVRYVPEAEVVHAIGASTNRRRVAMTVEHARSLDRFYAVAYAAGWQRLLRPAVRVGLAAWVLLTVARRAATHPRRGTAPAVPAR